MSVTFFDPNNPAVYNDDGDQVGGGTEVNFNNHNAYGILMLMGMCGPDNHDMFGDLDGDTFRKNCIRALSVIDMMQFNVKTNCFELCISLKSKISRLLVVFDDSERICWG